ncbi:MAG: CYTH domain-containing protein [Melioribacter sp.]|nr:CYTH domain-containing protein [Melioribacter sp.]
MPLNLELKIKVESHTKLINALRRINAEKKGILKQKDIYYKTRNGLLKLRVEGNNFTLIKYLRDEKGKRWSNYELLRLEGKNPEKYLNDVFDVDTVVEKKRILYLYKNTRIHLDEVKGLGKFLELETLLVSTRKDAEKRFRTIIKLLDLDLSRQIRKSYKLLMLGK